MNTPRKLDLRRSLRLTLAEGRLLVALLAEAKGREASSARIKLCEAIRVAEHTCPPTGGCPICGSSAGLKEHRAKLFRESLANSKRLTERLTRETHASAKREALLHPPPLKLTK